MSSASKGPRWPAPGGPTLSSDSPGKVLVLHADQLRDQDQVAVAILRAASRGGKGAPAIARCSRSRRQERSRVRAGPGIALSGRPRPCGICPARRSARAWSNAATIFSWSSDGIGSWSTPPSPVRARSFMCICKPEAQCARAPLALINKLPGKARADPCQMVASTHQGSDGSASVPEPSTSPALNDWRAGSVSRGGALASIPENVSDDASLIWTPKARERP